MNVRFQSTLSLRRATIFLALLTGAGADFNPRSPCGERPRVRHPGEMGKEFQSTLSLRRATGDCDGLGIVRPGISIHALLAESDRFRA